MKTVEFLKTQFASWLYCKKMKVSQIPCLWEDIGRINYIALTWHGGLSSLDYFVPYDWFLLRFFQWARDLVPFAIIFGFCVWSVTVIGLCFAYFGGLVVSYRSPCVVPRLLVFMQIAWYRFFSRGVCMRTILLI